MELPVPMGVLHGPQEEYGRGRSVMPTLSVDWKTMGTGREGEWHRQCLSYVHNSSNIIGEDRGINECEIFSKS